MDGDYNIFVYGTLRRGEPINFYLGDFEYVGEGKIEGYDMYTTGHFPYIVAGKGTITGEVYKVKNGLTQLAMLDTIEHGYVRIPKKIKMDNKELTAYTYIFPGEPTSFGKIFSGDWKDAYQLTQPST